MKLKSKMLAKTNDRRMLVLERLQAQLKSGVKPDKQNASSEPKMISLEEADIKRIKKEISTLTERVIPYELAIRVKPKKFRGVR